jgi:hypothetical protein
MFRAARLAGTQVQARVLASTLEYIQHVFPCINDAGARLRAIWRIIAGQMALPAVPGCPPVYTQSVFPGL